MYLLDGRSRTKNSFVRDESLLRLYLELMPSSERRNKTAREEDDLLYNNSGVSIKVPTLLLFSSTRFSLSPFQLSLYPYYLAMNPYGLFLFHPWSSPLFGLSCVMCPSFHQPPCSITSLTAKSNTRCVCELPRSLYSARGSSPSGAALAAFFKCLMVFRFFLTISRSFAETRRVRCHNIMSIMDPIASWMMRAGSS